MLGRCIRGAAVPEIVDLRMRRLLSVQNFVEPRDSTSDITAMGAFVGARSGVKALSSEGAKNCRRDSSLGVDPLKATADLSGLFGSRGMHIFARDHAGQPRCGFAGGGVERGVRVSYTVRERLPDAGAASGSVDKRNELVSFMPASRAK